jgi:hypothetical protein
MKKTVIISILGVLALSSCKKDELTPEPTPTPVDNTATNYNLLNGGTNSKYWFQDSMVINDPINGFVTYSSLSYPWTQYTTEEVWNFAILQDDFDINYGDMTPDPSYTYSLSELGSVINFVSNSINPSPAMSSYKIVSLTETKLTLRTFDSDTLRYFHKQ